MKDYDEFFIGDRTSKYDEEDLKAVLSKLDIDKFFIRIWEKIEELTPVSITDQDEEETNNSVNSAYRLGYLQGKKDTLHIIDDFEIKILNYIDEFLK